MLASKGKISTRQSIMLFFMTTISPAIRIFPQYAAKYAGKAGWLTPLAAIIPMIILVYILNSFFKNNPNSNLSDIFSNILGKFIGKIVVILYFIWIYILLSLYIRYYAERILSSMLPNTSISFLISVMLVMVFFAARSGLTPIARLSEIFFSIFLFTFVVIFILSLPQIRFRNYMYISYKDAWPVVKASYCIFGLWGYLLFVSSSVIRLTIKRT